MKRYNSWSLLLYILAVESCKNDQFQCTNGLCVLLQFRCDNSFECGDRSDELNCTKTKPCPEGLVRCVAGNCVGKYDDCSTPQSKVHILSSSVTRQFQTFFPTTQNSSTENVLVKTSPTSRGKSIRLYTTFVEKQLSVTNEKVVFTITELESTVKDIKVETTSTLLKQIDDTHPSLQSTSYMMGLSYDYSHFGSSMDDKTKMHKPTKLSYSPLYMLYSSIYEKRSKNPVTKMISRKTETFKTFFQNMSVPQTTAMKSEHLSSSNAILQLSNQHASTEALPEATSNSATIESNIELTQFTSSIHPLTSETSTMVTFSTAKPTVIGYLPNENYNKVIIWCTGILVMYLLTAVWGKTFVDNCRKYKRQEIQGYQIHDSIPIGRTDYSHIY